MTDESDQSPAREVHNEVLAGTDSKIVQAGTVSGGIHYYPTPQQTTRRESWLMPVPSTRGAIPRPELLDAIVEALRADATSVALTGLEGAGGFGKTTLAALACTDERVRAHFPDGVLWKTLGQRIKITDAEIVTAVNELTEYLTGQRPTYSDPQLAGSHLASVIGDRRCLLVLDDVWRADQLEPFLIGAPNCVRLVTTRIGSVVPADAGCIRVDALTSEQAEAILGRGLGVDSPTLSGLVVRTGRWPVLCGLVNPILRRLAKRGHTIVEAIRWAEDMLDTGGPAALDTTDSAAREQAIARTIEASLSMLAEIDAGAVDRYRELGVFRAGTDIPLEALVRYWHHNGGLGRYEAKRLCYLYADANLIKDFQLDPPTICLHDVIAAYLHHDARPRAAALQRSFLNSYRTDLQAEDSLPTAWWELPTKESYLWHHLIYHLREAGHVDELAALFRDLRWSTVKIHQLGPASVEADASLLPDEEHAKALGQLTRRTSHLYKPGDSMMMTTATFAAYAAGDRVLGAGAMRLVKRVAVPHLRPTAPPLPDQPHPAVSRVLNVGGARAFAADPNGGWLASAGHAEPVRVWNLADGTEMFSLPGSENSALAVAPHGRWLAGGTDDGSIRVWDMPAGTERALLSGPTKSRPIRFLAFAPPHGRLLASSGSGEVHVWDTSDGKLHAIVSDSSWVKAMVWAPDGSWLAVASSFRDQRRWIPAWVWRAADGARFNLAPGGTPNEARALTVAPDGSWLATAEFAQIRLFDPVDWQVLRVLKGHSGWVSALAVDPNGAWLASAGEDGTVRVWNPATGKQTCQLTAHTGKIDSLVAAPDGSWLACAVDGRMATDDNSVRVWNVADCAAPTVLTGHTQHIRALLTTPNVYRLISASDDDTVRVWSLSSDQSAAEVADHSGKITALVMAPDGSWAATGGNDGRVRLWNTADGTARAVLHGHAGHVSSLVVAPDGSWLASAGHDGAVRMWNTVDLAIRRTLRLDTDSESVSDLVVAPNGCWLAAAGEAVWVWDAESGKVLTRRPLRGAAPVTSLVAAGDGSWLGGADSDGSVTVWNLAAGTRRTKKVPSLGAPINPLASAPDGSWLASAEADGPITLWNARDGGFKTILRGHTAVRGRFAKSIVLRLAVDPNGSWLASVGSDAYARLWNLSDSTQQAFVHHSDTARDVAVAPDGSWLASVGSDGTVRVFDPRGQVWASIRLDSELAHCVINPARPQLVVAGSRHVYFLDLDLG